MPRATWVCRCGDISAPWLDWCRGCGRPFEPRQGAEEIATEDGVTPVDQQRVALHAEGGRTAIAKELGRVEAQLAYAIRALQAIVDAPMYGDDEAWRDAERGEIARHTLSDLRADEGGDK